MKSKPLILGIVACLAAFGTASAHPHEYVAVGVDVGPTCDGFTTLPNSGGVCIPTSHLVPSATGIVTFTIVDDLTDPTSGFLCIDQDGDNVCDEDINSAFCDTVSVSDDALATAPWVIIFVDGPVLGNPVLSVCASVSTGTHGFIDHA